MKQIIKLENWKITEAIREGRPGAVDWEAIAESFRNGKVYEIGMPEEVHEALIHLKEISDTLLEDGDSRYCNWIQEKDWIYRCSFSGVEEADKIILHFKGVDAVGEFYLNGEYLDSFESAYLEYEFDVTDRLQEENILDVYFHSPVKMLRLYEEEMPDRWKGEVHPMMLLHKGRDYGAKFGYTSIGLFAGVQLECIRRAAIERLEYRVLWNVDYTQARVVYQIKVDQPKHDQLVKGNLSLEVTMQEESERSWAEYLTVSEDGLATGEIVIEKPLLWWPKNYGSHPLYQVSIRLLCGNLVLDERSEMTGLRHIRQIGSMRFEVNGKEVRLWGSGITPIYGISHSYYKEYALDMLDKLDKCNMNAVRIWGPGKGNPDEFYTELDKRGIFAWQDFPTGTWQMPDDEKYQNLYRQEAEWMVRRLKHHPSILLWCGGNEHIYMCELDGIKGRIGFEMLHEGFREVCQRLDPDRYYHVSCPYEGKYTNDPSYGDSHGSRAYCAYTPGEDYGVFFSEDIRVFPPQYKSAVRFMKEDIWEEGYVDTKPFGTEYAMPKSWEGHFSNNGHLKLGPIREYYDATTPEELIYKYAMAAAQDLYRIGANARTGNPEHAQLEKRKRTGHFFWKFNDSWPRFYCSFYDYYQECTLPYYAVKRVFNPLFLHLAVKDHIYLWGVNDTDHDVCGKMEVKVFHMLKNQVIQEMCFPAAYRAGQASSICLDELGPINWNCVIYARFVCETDEPVTVYAFVTKENMLAFPQAKLTVICKDDILEICTDSYARCVELTGITEEGDEFGWYFSDNYFDLLPFEKKTIKVEGRHKKGAIRAKAHYSKFISEVEIKLTEEEC